MSQTTYRSSCWSAISASSVAVTLSFAVLVNLTPRTTWGQSGGQFEILRSTIDGGGGRSTGGSFVLTGTIAQPDASVLPMAGGDFALQGGFWGGLGLDRPDLIFSDGFEVREAKPSANATTPDNG